MFRLKVFRGIASLISFLTSIPLRCMDLELAARYFFLVPIVAAIEALMGFAAIMIAYPSSSPWLSASIFLLIHISITRGLHLDGLADYADAVGSLKRGVEALAVMKDPRKGAFAMIAISLYVAITIASLSTILGKVLDPLTVLGIIISTYLWSFESMYVIAMLSNPEPYPGLGKKFVEYSKCKARLLWNLLIVAMLQALCVYLCGYSSLIPLATSLITSLALYFDCRRRLGFANGDVLGAANELSKMLSLLGLAVASVRAPWMFSPT